MIIYHIDNILVYRELITGLEAGIRALQSRDKWEPGRYEFEGGYFMIQEGVTKPMEEGTYEAHRRYVDVQILLSGCEELAWKEYQGLTPVIPYNPDKDQERLAGKREHIMLISEGMFYAAFPQDGHKAVAHTKEPHSYRKAVMKLPVRAGDLFTGI